MFKRWLGQLALYYCREILQAEYQAAIIHRNTLRMGANGMMPIETASDKVISSLDIQISALEALMGIPSDV
jgi:hypothetical protein